MTVYRQDALDQTGARLHLIVARGPSTGGSGFYLLDTPYSHPAPAESPGGVEDFCNLCRDALKALNP